MSLQNPLPLNTDFSVWCTNMKTMSLLLVAWAVRIHIYNNRNAGTALKTKCSIYNFNVFIILCCCFCFNKTDWELSPNWVWLCGFQLFFQCLQVLNFEIIQYWSDPQAYLFHNVPFNTGNNEDYLTIIIKWTLNLQQIFISLKCDFLYYSGFLKAWRKANAGVCKRSNMPTRSRGVQI